MGRKAVKAEKQQITNALARSEPWLSKKDGLRVMTVTSILFAVYVGYVVYPVDGFGTAILYGALAGAAVWAIFLVSLAVNTVLRR